MKVPLQEQSLPVTLHMSLEASSQVLPYIQVSAEIGLGTWRPSSMDSRELSSTLLPKATYMDHLGSMFGRGHGVSGTLKQTQGLSEHSFPKPLPSM